MDWTSREPIDGLKCIVRTEADKLFPAVWKDGCWLHSEQNFCIHDAKDWIVYPETESDDLKKCVPPEVDCRYLKKQLEEEREKMKELRLLNKTITSEYITIKAKNKELYSCKLKLDHYIQLEQTMMRVRDILANPKLWPVIEELKELEEQ